MQCVASSDVDDEVGGVLDHGGIVGGTTSWLEPQEPALSTTERIRAAARLRAEKFRDEDTHPVLAGVDDDSDDGELADPRPRRPVRQAVAHAPSYALKLSLSQPADARTAARRGVPKTLTKAPPPAAPGGVTPISALLRERRIHRRHGTDAEGRALAASIATGLHEDHTSVGLTGMDDAVARLVAQDAALEERTPSWRYWIEPSDAGTPAHIPPANRLRRYSADDVPWLLDLAVRGSATASDALVRCVRSANGASELWRALPHVLIRLGADPALVLLEPGSPGSSQEDFVDARESQTPPRNTAAEPAVSAIWRPAAAAPAPVRADAASVAFTLANLGAGYHDPMRERAIWRAAAAMDESGAGAVASALSQLNPEHCATVLRSCPDSLRRRTAAALLGRGVPGETLAQLDDALAQGDYRRLFALTVLVDYATSGATAQECGALVAPLQRLYSSLRDGRGMDLDSSRAKDRVQRLQLRLRYQAWTQKTSGSLF